MKKVLSIFGILSAVFLTAQTSLTNTENYIYSKNCLNDDCTKTSENVQYFDSFGRPYQSISIKSSPTGKDMVQHIPYDSYGRSVDSWFPVPMSTMGGAVQDSTTVKSNALTVYGDSRPFSHTILEKSPLSRPLSQISPGQEWQTHPVTLGYNANTGNEVKKYTVSTTWVEGRTESALSFLGNYPANTLTKNTATDEDGNVSVEFKNKQGQIILVKKGVGTSDVTDTYYVYNEYGHLVYVLPPLAANVSVTPDVLETLCYQYRYDGGSRLVEKKIPGKGWEYMVYDKADRLVLTQDANLRAQGKWLFTKYDQFSRPIYTGILDSPPGRIQQVNAIQELAFNNEVRSSASWNNSGMDVYYTNNTAYPTTNFKLLSVNYYDTYPSYSFNPSVPSSVYGSQILTDNMTADMNTKGVPVMSLVKNIEDDNWTKNYNWYDTKGRLVGSQTINHLGGYTKTESDIDFSGLVNQTKVYHKRLSTDTEKLITQNYQYDNQGRLLVQKHKVDTNPEEILTQNEYNELSQLVKKKVGGINIAQPLQTIDYTYNVRGSLIKINDPVALNGKLFGYEIKYTWPIDIEKRYNGNITEVDWKTASDNVLRRYDYRYDALNRLTLAHYREPMSSVSYNNFYNEEAAYDSNGNMTRLWRNTKNSSGTAELIDNLVYTYSGNKLTSVSDLSQNSSGYPYLSVPNTIGYDNGNTDGNGNMTSHIDKGINAIEYNFLNLPSAIKESPGTQKEITTQYTYRADGVKIEKLYRKTSTQETVTTLYLDGFQYSISNSQTKGSALQFVPTSEGYFDFIKNKYIYHYLDHLGNVRVSYCSNGSGAEIIEENNYYPFGLKHEGYNALSGNTAYKYKYNGKELQETGMYDYGARFYMPDIARWGVMDPLAEQMRRYSPYNYAFNNPISFVDPDGRKPQMYNDAGNVMHWDFDPATTIEGSSWFRNSEYAPRSGFAGATMLAGSGGGDGSNTKRTPGKNSTWSSIKSFFNSIFGGGKKSSSSLEVGPVEKITEQESSISAWQIVSAVLFGNVDPYSAIGNAGVGPYAEERETVGLAAMLFINPEAAAEGLEKKALSRVAMSKIWGAGSLRIDPKNLPKTVTEDMVEILAGRGVRQLDEFGLPAITQNRSGISPKWVGALEWKIKDVPGSIGLNSSRIVQHPDGRWGLVINHDYTKIIQIPTSSVIK
ncbi:RHS repeat-associated core domain-containing protein [Chryseobacterium soli]|uniref:RHS repeat domain-containing protein n=1 Tax=Chryseobacterium soli TaxID=445961 RepID=UPI002953204E|nr:DUF6443 domain-containing protein [Chryseobacterium soli]MDV7697654.1 RHS repeat-associated core domain-containing protein [Chryseobacterium soli]